MVSWLIHHGNSVTFDSVPIDATLWITKTNLKVCQIKGAAVGSSGPSPSSESSAVEPLLWAISNGYAAALGSPQSAGMQAAYLSTGQSHMDACHSDAAHHSSLGMGDLAWGLKLIEAENQFRDVLVEWK